MERHQALDTLRAKMELEATKEAHASGLLLKGERLICSLQIQKEKEPNSYDPADLGSIFTDERFEKHKVSKTLVTKVRDFIDQISYDSTKQTKASLQDFLAAYPSALRLRTLGHLPGYGPKTFEAMIGILLELGIYSR